MSLPCCWLHPEAASIDKPANSRQQRRIGEVVRSQNSSHGFLELGHGPAVGIRRRLAKDRAVNPKKVQCRRSVCIGSP